MTYISLRKLLKIKGIANLDMLPAMMREVSKTGKQVQRSFNTDANHVPVLQSSLPRDRSMRPRPPRWTRHFTDESWLRVRHTGKPIPVLALTHVIRDGTFGKSFGTPAKAVVGNRTAHKLLDNSGLRVFNYEPI